MTADRRTDNATRAALLRLRLAEQRVCELPAFQRTANGAEASAELGWAIDGIVSLLRDRGDTNDVLESA